MWGLRYLFKVLIQIPLDKYPELRPLGRPAARVYRQVGWEPGAGKAWDCPMGWPGTRDDWCRPETWVYGAHLLGTRGPGLACVCGEVGCLLHSFLHRRAPGYGMRGP